MSKQKKWYQSNSAQVLLAGFISFVLTTIFLKPSFYKSLLGLEHINLIDIDLSENRMVWTLITAIVSAPVAFAIWRLRDKNVSEQIENSRKDTNLKEFQKLAEWVSGAHFVEEKVSIKTKYEEAENSEKKVIEETREYTTPSNELSIHTYSKMDGAVGLQIAAIYNLLPFYRGDHGESFRRPALNLLLSAWKAMQQKDLASLEIDTEYERAIKNIREKGKSPLAVAITHTLLAEGGKLFREFMEDIPNICLAGMDFELQGLDPEKLRDIFQSTNKLIKLKNIDFRASYLGKIRFNDSFLVGCNFNECQLSDTQYINSVLFNCKFNKSNSFNCNFFNANFTRCSLSKSCFFQSDFSNTILDDTYIPENLGGIQWLNSIIIANKKTPLESIKELINEGAIIVKSPDKYLDDVLVKFTHKESGVERTYRCNIDLEETKKLNPNWEITQA